MSKVRLQSYLRLLLLLAGLQIFTEARAQGIEADIVIDAQARTATVSGRFTDAYVRAASRHVVFKKQVAGSDKLAERVSDLQLGSGNPVSFRRLMAGEYLAESEYKTWSYRVDLKPSQTHVLAAHASWLGEDSGILMLDDLLPQFATKGESVAGKIKLSLPPGWTSLSADPMPTTNVYNVTNMERSVIYIGREIRRADTRGTEGKLSVALTGNWLFTDAEAAEMADEIFSEYSKLLGPLPSRSYLILIGKFSGKMQPGAWEAETRGRTVTIMSSDMPFRTQSLQRLHEQLRHEIFHLWFPNGVNLKGDYAWFYEGFALYQSMKLAVKINQIRFEDFLESLSRAHTIDANTQPRRALMDAAIDPTVRYARGMMVAFLIDLDLMTKGKKDVTNRLKTLFAKYSSMSASADASESVKSVLESPRIIERYVSGAETVKWTAELHAAGIESKREGRTTTLSVVAKPRGRQKEILDRLGYNNWRKIGTKR